MIDLRNVFKMKDINRINMKLMNTRWKTKDKIIKTLVKDREKCDIR